MKSSLGKLSLYAAVLLAMSNLMPNTWAQQPGALQPLPVGVNVHTQISHHSGINPVSNSAAIRASNGGAAIPMSGYTVTASDGNTYSGTLVGTSPFDSTAGTTTVASPIIPVVINVSLPGIGPYSSDPTALDPCLSSGSDTDLVSNSPLFNSTDYIMNGEAVGNTQYVDASERASFWSLVAGTDYHVLLQPTVMDAQIFNTFTQGFFDQNPLCGGATYQLFFDINEFDNWIRNVALPTAGVDPTQFPILLLQNVNLYNGVIQNCCIGGYHSAEGGSFQTYSPSNVDTANYFVNDSDVATLSHEIAEWVNDPLGNNPTPAWGHIGQVTGCQNNLEVGDPLTGTLFPTVTLNGVDYHPQELAFFSWFFGDDPSLGAGGQYSNNGTFAVPAAPCPPPPAPRR